MSSMTGNINDGRALCDREHLWSDHPQWQETSMKESFLVTDIENIYEGTVLSAIGNISEKSTLSIKAMIKAWIYFFVSEQGKISTLVL